MQSMRKTVFFLGSLCNAELSKNNRSASQWHHTVYDERPHYCLSCDEIKQRCKVCKMVHLPQEMVRESDYWRCQACLQCTVCKQRRMEPASFVAGDAVCKGCRSKAEQSMQSMRAEQVPRSVREWRQERLEATEAQPWGMRCIDFTLCEMRR